MPGSEFVYDPFSPELRRFAALGGLSAREGPEIAPDQMTWMMQVQDMLAGLTQRDWVRLRRVGLPETDWQGLAEWLSRFIAGQRADDRAIAKVSALNVSGDLDFAYEAMHGMGRGSMDPVEAEVYGRRQELDAAAGEFSAVVRTRAVEIAEEMLQRAAPAMQAERSRMQSRKEREALFAALASPTIPKAVLDDHPILYNAEILENAHNPRTPDDLGDWLRAEASFQADRIKYVYEHLHEKPDAVFGFDATLAELGLQQSVHQEIIEQGWGRSDGSSIFETLLTLILAINPIIGAIEAFSSFKAAVADYAGQEGAYALGMRTTKPSKAGVALAGVGLVLSGVLIAHGRSTTARSFGQIERLAGSEVSTAGRAGAAVRFSGEEVAAARVGEDVAAERACDDVAVAGDDVAAGRAGEEVAEAAGARSPEPIEPVREPVKGGHHVEVNNRGIEYCSPDPCPLLRVENANELQANEELAQRLKAIEDLRATDPVQAASAAREIRESLEYVRGHAELFADLPAHVTPVMKARLAGLLESAEDAGVRLGREHLNEISDALRGTKGAKAAGEILDSIEGNLAAHVELRQSFGGVGEIGGGSRPGDLAANLPEGTQALNPATKYPKEVSAFLQRHPKVHASPQSEAALDALYGHTKSGALSVTARAGRYVPTGTRSAAAEIESIEELAARPEVERIELIPSSSEGRTVDKIVDIRQPDGTVVRSRWEDRTITGAPVNYQSRGTTGWSVASADRIESAVRAKVTSTATKPSQFDALMVEAPTGGTLAVHVLNPGPSGSQTVADAMVNLAGDLSGSSVRAVEFFLPRQLLRYVRQHDGTFMLVSDRITVP
jgi:putative RNase-like toxin